VQPFLAVRPAPRHAAIGQMAVQYESKSSFFYWASPFQKDCGYGLSIHSKLIVSKIRALMCRIRGFFLSPGRLVRQFC